MVVNRNCGLRSEVSPGRSTEKAIFSWESCMIRDGVEDLIGNHASHIRDWTYRGLLIGNREHVRSILT